MASNAPIIIKRKKVIAGGGHHGGAWKVAYADFVTAMMAFFMLMWLLNATTETQRKGLADYFSPTIPLSHLSGGGENAMQGDDATSSESLMGTAGASDGPQAATATLSGRLQAGADPEKLPDALGEVEALLTAASGESMVADDLLKHILTRVTDEGLIVDLFDLPGARLFRDGTTSPTALGRELVAVVGEIFRVAKNEIAINGHVRSDAIVRLNPVGWDLSADRAQTVRTMIERARIDPKRIQRIGGYADRELLQSDPMDLRNNRIELILLR